MGLRGLTGGRSSTDGVVGSLVMMMGTCPSVRMACQGVASMGSLLSSTSRTIISLHSKQRQKKLHRRCLWGGWDGWLFLIHGWIANRFWPRARDSISPNSWRLITVHSHLPSFGTNRDRKGLAVVVAPAGKGCELPSSSENPFMMPLFVVWGCLHLSLAPCFPINFLKAILPRARKCENLGQLFNGWRDFVVMTCSYKWIKMEVGVEHQLGGPTSASLRNSTTKLWRGRRIPHLVKK